MSYREEGGGWTVTCTSCGWLVWNETRAACATAAHGHKCRKGTPS